MRKIVFHADHGDGINLGALALMVSVIWALSRTVLVDAWTILLGASSSANLVTLADFSHHPATVVAILKGELGALPLQPVGAPGGNSHARTAPSGLQISYAWAKVRSALGAQKSAWEERISAPGGNPPACGSAIAT